MWMWMFDAENVQLANCRCSFHVTHRSCARSGVSLGSRFFSRSRHGEAQAMPDAPPRCCRTVDGIRTLVELQDLFLVFRSTMSKGNKVKKEKNVFLEETYTQTLKYIITSITFYIQCNFMLKLKNVRCHFTSE